MKRAPGRLVAEWRAGRERRGLNHGGRRIGEISGGEMKISYLIASRNDNFLTVKDFGERDFGIRQGRRR